MKRRGSRHQRAQCTYLVGQQETARAAAAVAAVAARWGAQGAVRGGSRPKTACGGGLPVATRRAASTPAAAVASAAAAAATPANAAAAAAAGELHQAVPTAAATAAPDAPAAPAAANRSGSKGQALHHRRCPQHHAPVKLPADPCLRLALPRALPPPRPAAAAAAAAVKETFRAAFASAVADHSQAGTNLGPICALTIQARWHDRIEGAADAAWPRVSSPRLKLAQLRSMKSPSVRGQTW